MYIYYKYLLADHLSNTILADKQGQLGVKVSKGERIKSPRKPVNLIRFLTPPERGILTGTPTTFHFAVVHDQNHLVWWVISGHKYP